MMRSGEQAPFCKQSRPWILSRSGCAIGCLLIVDDGFLFLGLSGVRGVWRLVVRDD
jgi:hypothetical protein